MRSSLLAPVPILIFNAGCAPLPWTTYGSTTFPRPVDPRCITAVLRQRPEIDSTVLGAANPRDFGVERGTVDFGSGVGPVAAGPRFADVRFSGASGTGAVQQFDAGAQLRVTLSWTWRSAPVPDDSVRTTEARLQQYVGAIRAACGAGKAVDTLGFRHSWLTPSGE